jgi:hypothetical protein
LLDTNLDATGLTILVTNLDGTALTLLSVVLFATAIVWWIDIKLRPVPGVMACPLMVTGPIWAGIIVGFFLWGSAMLDSVLVWVLLGLFFVLICLNTTGCQAIRQVDALSDSGGGQG